MLSDLHLYTYIYRIKVFNNNFYTYIWKKKFLNESDFYYNSHFKLLKSESLRFTESVAFINHVKVSSPLNCGFRKAGGTVKDHIAPPPPLGGRRILAVKRWMWMLSWCQHISFTNHLYFIWRNLIVIRNTKVILIFFYIVVYRLKNYRQRIYQAPVILMYASPFYQTKSIDSRPKSRGERLIHDGMKRSTSRDSPFRSCSQGCSIYTFSITIVFQGMILLERSSYRFVK